MLVPIRRTGMLFCKLSSRGTRGKQISGAGGSKDGGYLAAAAVETVRGIACRLLMANYPMVKFRRLSQGFIDSNIVNAGYAKARADAMAHQSSNNSLCACHGTQMRRS